MFFLAVQWMESSISFILETRCCVCSTSIKLPELSGFSSASVGRTAFLKMKHTIIYNKINKFDFNLLYTCKTLLHMM